MGPSQPKLNLACDIFSTSASLVNFLEAIKGQILFSCLLWVWKQVPHPFTLPLDVTQSHWQPWQNCDCKGPGMQGSIVFGHPCSSGSVRNRREKLDLSRLTILFTVYLCSENKANILRTRFQIPLIAEVSAPVQVREQSKKTKNTCNQTILCNSLEKL